MKKKVAIVGSGFWNNSGAILSRKFDIICMRKNNPKWCFKSKSNEISPRLSLSKINKNIK